MKSMKLLINLQIFKELSTLYKNWLTYTTINLFSKNSTKIQLYKNYPSIFQILEAALIFVWVAVVMIFGS